LTAKSTPTTGGLGELLRLAWPLILSNSLWTLQIVIDRIFLSQSSPEEVGAGMMTAVLFWLPIALLQGTASYATTFVAQYTGAGRHRRVGPAVWQALYFSAAAGLGMMLLVPLAGPFFSLSNHTPELRALEAVYFRCLCFSALPMLVSSSVCSFFSGRGDSRTVLFINASGLGVNALWAYVLIFGRWGFPAMGIAGAGWATVLGTSTSAVLALTLMLLPRHEGRYATASGWRFEPELFGRLMRFGLPNGLFAALDTLGFAFFIYLIGGLGEVELAATSITFTLNMFAVLPMLGVGQAVEVLVGQRLGEDRPDLAERSTWVGFGAAWVFTLAVALAYAFLPDLLVLPFRSAGHPEEWERVRALVPPLLRFVAVYCLFDCVNLVFSFALRGAGDTRFVTRAALALSLGVLTVPTWLVLSWGGGIYGAWACASAYIILLAVTFLVRFRHGAWKSMRVIEAVPRAPGEEPAPFSPRGEEVLDGEAVGP
jgi:MATE family multidrug resistance protein